MVVSEKSFLKFSKNFLPEARLKIFSQKTFIKLFTDQSEVSTLTAGVQAEKY